MKVSDLMGDLEKGDRTMEHLKATRQDPQGESIFRTAVFDQLDDQMFRNQFRALSGMSAQYTIPKW